MLWVVDGPITNNESGFEFDAESAQAVAATPGPPGAGQTDTPSTMAGTWAAAGLIGKEGLTRVAVLVVATSGTDPGRTHALSLLSGSLALLRSFRAAGCSQRFHPFPPALPPLP